MITDALISFGVSVSNFILLLFPVSDGFPEEFNTAITTFSSYLANLSPILPYGTLLSIISIVLLFEFTLLGFNAFRWFFSHVPFIGGRGA